MAKISACVISFNEEDRIEDCLKSLRPIADEIVVVDSGSTDRTREIARRFADKLVEQPFLGYLEQKNFAVAQASHDWILSLDCDERVSPELARSILAFQDRLDERAAWSFNRRTYYLYRWMDHTWYPDAKVRLFDRRRCHWGGVNPHDRVIVTGGTAGHLTGDLHHYSFRNLSDHLNKLNRFTDIAAAELVREGRRISPWSPVTHGAAGFVRRYLFKRGFLDGFAGLTVAVSAAIYGFAKYAKAYLAGRAARR